MTLTDGQQQSESGRFWNSRTVLITGGAGFIGSNLATALLRLGSKVRIADNLGRGSLTYLSEILDQVDFRNVDLTNPEACLNSCEGIDTIVHLAARVGGINYYITKPGEVFADNAAIDLGVWRAALACGANYFIYASSTHIYPSALQAAPDSPPLSEEQAEPASPSLSYGWAKLFGEKLILFDSGGRERPRVGILRLIGAYGPNQDIALETGSVIPVLIRRALEYPIVPFLVRGSGNETRSFCYIDDVVHGILECTAALRTRPVLGPLNLGNEGRVSIAELAGLIAAQSGKNIEIVFDPSFKPEIVGQAVSCSKAFGDLPSWRPRVNLMDGIQRCYLHIAARLSRGGPALRIAGNRTRE
jgi:nucleoside-diphosphate-sugar epimerase